MFFLENIIIINVFNIFTEMRLIGFSKIHLSTFYPIFASICYITRQYSLTLISLKLNIIPHIAFHREK